MKITTPKLLDLTPTWAHYVGWTILFDDSSRVRAAIPEPLPDQRRADNGDAYLRLARVGKWIEQLSPRIAVAWLPSSSFHVTLMDGLSATHIERVRPRALRRKLRGQLSDLPASLRDPQGLIGGVDITPLLEVANERVVMKFDKIRCRGHAVLADFEIIGDADLLHEARRRTLDELARRTRLPLSTHWRPHVTLGYFPNLDVASASKKRVESIAADAPSGPATEETELVFRGAGLYGFTDMVSYWR